MSVPTNVYAGIAKYPLLADPDVRAGGSIFERSGVAPRLVRFASRMVGARPRIAGGRRRARRDDSRRHLRLGPGQLRGGRRRDDRDMLRAGYPKPFIGQRHRCGSGDRHPDPAIDRFHHLLPAGAAGPVPALFAAGMIPGILAGLHADRADLVISPHHGFGEAEKRRAAAPFWRASEAFWGLMAPVVILGGMRSGWFTPTEAAVMAVFYGLFVGIVIYRSLSCATSTRCWSRPARSRPSSSSSWRWPASSPGRRTRSASFDQIAKAIVVRASASTACCLLILMLIVIGMFLDGVSTFLILLPLLIPIANTYQLGPGLVRRDHHHEDRHRPVHAADGGQPMVSCRIAACRWRRPSAGSAR